MKKTIELTIKNGKISFDIEALKAILQEETLTTNIKYKPTPKPMAFNTKTELDEYVTNNPQATCKGIPMKKLVRFIKENQGQYLFLKEANLRDADLPNIDLRYAYFIGADCRCANFSGADFCFANFCDADLRYAYFDGSDFFGTKYNQHTKFPKWFGIPNTMRKLD